MGFIVQAYIESGNDTLVPMIFIERYDGMESGYDEFGVHWTYMEDVFAPMTTPGRILCDDITNWRNQVTVPRLEVSWRGI